MYWTILKHYPETRLRLFSRSKVFFCKFPNDEVKMIVSCVGPTLAFIQTVDEGQKRKFCQWWFQKMKASWMGNLKEGIKGEYKEIRGDFKIFMNTSCETSKLKGYLCPNVLYINFKLKTSP